MEVVITPDDDWFPNSSRPSDKSFDWEDTAPSEYEPPTDNRYAPPERRAELESNPRPEEEIADWFVEKPDESDEIEKEKTIHEKMYQMATKNGGSWLGGSENLGGGSEERLEEEFTPENDPYGGY